MRMLSRQPHERGIDGAGELTRVEIGDGRPVRAIGNLSRPQRSAVRRREDDRQLAGDVLDVVVAAEVRNAGRIARRVDRVQARRRRRGARRQQYEKSERRARAQNAAIS
jgi:hypothetical protein